MISDIGSNENGTYVQWANGLQVCFVRNTELGYYSASNLRGRWGFPKPFSENPVAFVTPTGMSGAPNHSQIGFLRTRSPSKGSIYFDLYRIQGFPSFESSDIATCDAVAIGMWK